LEGPRSIATATIEKRQFFRYAQGEVRTPQTVARRYDLPLVEVLAHLRG
jgi:hypothetical protein